MCTALCDPKSPSLGTDAPSSIPPASFRADPRAPRCSARHQWGPHRGGISPRGASPSAPRPTLAAGGFGKQPPPFVPILPLPPLPFPSPPRTGRGEGELGGRRGAERPRRGAVAAVPGRGAALSAPRSGSARLGPRSHAAAVPGLDAGFAHAAGRLPHLRRHLRDRGGGGQRVRSPRSAARRMEEEEEEDGGWRRRSGARGAAGQFSLSPALPAPREPKWAGSSLRAPRSRRQPREGPPGTPPPVGREGTGWDGEMGPVLVPLGTWRYRAGSGAGAGAGPPEARHPAPGWGAEPGAGPGGGAGAVPAASGW